MTRSARWSHVRPGRWKAALSVGTAIWIAAPLWAQATPQSGFSAWSPDGSRVALSMAIDGPWQLYLIDPFNRERRRLTRSEGNDISPTWSADGSRIVFISDRDGNMELYSIAADGSDERRLTHTAGSEMAPDLTRGDRLTWAWSEESDPSMAGRSSRVVQGTLEAPTPSLLFDGGVQHYPVWAPEGEAFSFSGTLPGQTGYGVWVQEPGEEPHRVSGELTAFNSSWSWDGERLVFVSPVEGVERIFEVDRDGGGLRQLTDNTEPWFEPRIGPDGRILVRVGSGPDHRGIAILNPQGGFTAMLVEPGAAPVITSAPTWAPNGGHLLFVSDADGHPQVWRMNPDGGQSRRLSDGRFSERNPSYSPDGEWIAIVSVESGKPEIWRMRADGSHRTQVTDETSTTAQPRWSPDGRWLYYRIGGEENLFMRIHPDGSGREVLFRPEWPEIYLVPNPVDGRILTSGVPPGSRYNQILVRERLGAPPRNISNRNAPSYNPDWSPDGEWIVFVSHVGEDFHSALFIARSDGSQVRQLTDFPEGSYQPRWSPDGESIVFRRGWTNHVGLFSVNPDGSNLEQLTNLDSVH